MTLRILTICTGNICRSPLTAMLLAARLEPGAFTIHSAGISVLSGDTIPDALRPIAARMGAHGAELHRSIAVSPHAVAEADLILGMELEHRRHAAQLHPHAGRRAFTLLEFAHIASSISDEDFAALVPSNNCTPGKALEAVQRMRGAVPRLNPERLYDVEDPFGRSKQVYERSAKQIERAVDHIVQFFRRTEIPAPPAAPELPRQETTEHTPSSFSSFLK